MLKRFSLSIALLGVACAGPPPPAAPARPEPVSMVNPPAAPAVSAQPAAPPVADQGPPPQPPMAMRWTFDLPSVSGRPWSKQHLAVTEDGSVSWESESGGGDGEVDETLTPVANGGAAPAVRCRGRVGPGLHRKVVEAARRAMSAGCKAKAARQVDEAVTSIAVTWEGEVKACTVARSGGGYAAFEQVKGEVIAAACARR